MEERLYIVKLPGKDAFSRSASEAATISLTSSTTSPLSALHCNFDEGLWLNSGCIESFPLLIMGPCSER